MNIGDIGRLLRSNTKEHFPLILSAAAGVGTLATAYLTGKASFEASDIIKQYELKGGDYGDRYFSNRDTIIGRYLDKHDRAFIFVGRTQLVWKLYILPATSAITTIGCIIGANRVEVKKTIAAQTAFAVSQRVYSEYRDKVIEEYGERKDQSIRDKIADEHVKKTAPSKEVIVTGPGNVLCCELFTGRYFISDMEKLRRAQNELNARLLAHDYATFDDFYYMINLPRTSSSSQIGWRSSKLMDLVFSTALTEDGRPCLAFEYNYTEPL